MSPDQEKPAQFGGLKPVFYRWRVSPNSLLDRRHNVGQPFLGLLKNGLSGGKWVGSPRRGDRIRLSLPIRNPCLRLLRHLLTNHPCAAVSARPPYLTAYPIRFSAVPFLSADCNAL